MALIDRLFTQLYHSNTTFSLHCYNISGINEGSIYTNSSIISCIKSACHFSFILMLKLLPFYIIVSSTLFKKMEKNAYDIANRIHLNIRGQPYEIEKSLSQKLPDALLAQLNTNHANYSVSKGKYFFNRDPVIFNCILNYYVTGKLM